MHSKKPSSKEPRPSCAEAGPEDGVDPRDFYRRETPRITNRKALQLCGQVARALNGALPTCGDEVLRDLYVVSVAPAPHAGRLLVTVTRTPSAPAVDNGVVQEHLQRAAGLLRSEVAAAIHRRRAPELTFAVA